jgi:DnaJ family protein C protein 27
MKIVNTNNSQNPMDSIRIKILTLGSIQVGKSCFVKKFCEPSRFASGYIPTIGVDYGVKTVSRGSEDGGAVDVKIDFYDLSGKAVYIRVICPF